MIRPQWHRRRRWERSRHAFQMGLWDWGRWITMIQDGVVWPALLSFFEEDRAPSPTSIAAAAGDDRLQDERSWGLHERFNFLVDLSHFARQPSSSVCMWALWVREWGHMATSRPLRASNQIFKLLQMFLKRKKKKEKERGPFCNCAVPHRENLLCSYDDTNVKFVFKQIQT